MTAPRPASAADQTILGKQLVVKNPVSYRPDRRKLVVTAKEAGSSATLVGDPTVAGATVTLTANGGTPSVESFSLAGGTSALTGQPFWRGDIVHGFQYKDPRGENGPVIAALLKKSDTGVFQINAVAVGKLWDIAPPPDPGTDGCMRLDIGGGGDTYHVRFADGQVTNDGAKQFKVLNPVTKGTCPPTTTTTTTTTLPTTTTTTTLSPCALLTSWGGAGSGNGQFSQFSYSPFGGPAGVATDGSGNVYVADPGNSRIQKFDARGRFLTAWGSSGSGNGQFFFSGPAYEPSVATDGSGDVYVADPGNSRIQKFDASGTFLTAWGSPGSGNGQFLVPAGVATDGSGNVYVADAGLVDDRIQKFAASGTFLTAWGSSGSGNGQFRFPVGVATDGSGNVYVADENERIQKFDASGTFLAAWGSPGSGNGQFDFQVSFGVLEFVIVASVATDGSENVYVADPGNSRIQKFDASGTFLAAWGSPGSGNGQFSFPVGVATDQLGHVYVADAGNDRIQKFACQ
jgi:hypothetical protein